MYPLVRTPRLDNPPQAVIKYLSLSANGPYFASGDSRHVQIPEAVGEAHAQRRCEEVRHHDRPVPVPHQPGRNLQKTGRVSFLSVKVPLHLRLVERLRLCGPLRFFSMK